MSGETRKTFKFGSQWRYKKEDIGRLIKKSKGGNG